MKFLCDEMWQVLWSLVTWAGSSQLNINIVMTISACLAKTYRCQPTGCKIKPRRAGKIHKSPNLL